MYVSGVTPETYICGGFCERFSLPGAFICLIYRYAYDYGASGRCRYSVQCQFSLGEGVVDCHYGE